MPRGHYDRSKAKKRVSQIGVVKKGDPLDDMGESFESALHKVKVLRDRVKALELERDNTADELRAACSALANISDE